MAAVVAIHAGLALAFLNLSGTIELADPQDALRVFDVKDVPPPEPPPPPPQQAERPKPKEEEGGASPLNIRSEATPVVAPEPRIALPVPVPIATTETPRDGAAPTQGAADVRGPGTGAGGVGTGTGSGGAGSGPGGGGGGGIATPPRLIQGNITRRDYPRELRGSRVPQQEIEMEFTIGVDGRVRNCRAIRSSGNPILDASTCRLVEQRYVYQPARNRAGQPVSIIGRMRRSWWIER